ncbi:hypothetical protein GQ53DRAFT_163591 [Thozetella sp. PMI_491]|nr:hypothetical protein GQ53DRAFT_163591 [Thozetella sp. PMI_491]
MALLWGALSLASHLPIAQPTGSGLTGRMEIVPGKSLHEQSSRVGEHAQPSQCSRGSARSRLGQSIPLLAGPFHSFASGRKSICPTPNHRRWHARSLAGYGRSPGCDWSSLRCRRAMGHLRSAEGGGVWRRRGGCEVLWGYRSERERSGPWSAPVCFINSGCQIELKILPIAPIATNRPNWASLAIRKDPFPPRPRAFRGWAKTVTAAVTALPNGLGRRLKRDPGRAHDVWNMALDGPEDSTSPLERPRS